MKPLILVADDEADMLNMVCGHFKAAGYQTLPAEDGTVASKLIRERLPSIAVLDLMMPGMNGLEVLRATKSHPRTARIPVVLLTALATETDRVVAFELGADDYVTKPFSPRELVLRVRGILQRMTMMSEASGLLVSGSLQLDLEHHSVTAAERDVHVTVIEFKLLAELMKGGGRVQTREGLLNTVWGVEHEIDVRTVDTHIRRLRDKLGPAGEQIRTVRNIGYKLDAA